MTAQPSESHNESRHYFEGDEWLERAKDNHEAGIYEAASSAALIAAACYAGAQAADEDREATAAQRLARAVKDGTDALDVSVRGNR